MSTENSRICIVTTRNIFDSPCIDKYKALIEEPFDIVYWDRCGIEEECGAANYFKYNGLLSSYASKFQKLCSYAGFVIFVNRFLKKHTYDKLIVFPTQMGWLIQGKLCHKYKKKYIMDIRDYAGENFFLFSKMTKRIVNNSGVCSITSPAYQKFLPERDYLISHNIQPMPLELIRQYRTRERNPEQPIVLSFIGSVRFIEQQKKLISLFQNDSRFQLNFIGSGSEQLESFCREKMIENVKLIGRFNRDELPKFYMETDMAINVYGNNDPYLDYALSNKLYSAAMMGMPILVSPNTYMEVISKKYGFGLAVDLNDKNCLDEVYEYYTNCDRKKIQYGCDRFLCRVEEDEMFLSGCINHFLNNQ